MLRQILEVFNKFLHYLKIPIDFARMRTIMKLVGPKAPKSYDRGAAFNSISCLPPDSGREKGEAAEVPALCSEVYALGWQRKSVRLSQKCGELSWWCIWIYVFSHDLSWLNFLFQEESI